MRQLDAVPQGSPIISLPLDPKWPTYITGILSEVGEMEHPGDIQYQEVKPIINR